MSDPAEVVVELVDAVRAEGVDVPPGASVVLAQALGVLRADRPAEVVWAARATLIGRPEDIPALDRALARVLEAPIPVAAGSKLPTPRTLAVDVAGDASVGDVVDEVTEPGDVQSLRWSAREVLRTADLGACTEDELAEAYRLIAELRVRAERRPSRRRRPARHGHGDLDVRGTVRRALRTGGEVTRPAVSRPGHRPRRLVLLLDVSGSMEPYARALVRFAHAAVAARRRGGVEVFALGTRVTAITRELATHDPDEALRSAVAAIADWSGGTRLGEGMRSFNDRWGVRGLARGSIVVILSDGWDRGEPEVLAAEMARLHRVAHRVIWVNPLKASPGYEPLVRGMQAALPHVDEFLAGHSIASLEQLAIVVGGGRSTADA